jgi:hypothetical protein
MAIALGGGAILLLILAGCWWYRLPKCLECGKRVRTFKHSKLAQNHNVGGKRCYGSKRPTY